MVRLDHLAISVTDETQSRDWYVSNFGFRVEFEVPERHTIALQDDGGFTIFLVRDPIAATRPSCTLTLQVADVEAKHAQLAARGVRFEKLPQKLYWGYGAELSDPDGYRVHVWDEKSMREKGDA